VTSEIAGAVLGVALSCGLWHELRRRGELVARACHELRGPLTAAHLALHAGAPRGGPLPASLAAIDVELARAGRALDDLAAARRGARGPHRAELVDVGALVRAQVAAWEAVAPAYGCTLRSTVAVGGDALVRGDRVRLAQAVGNLLANACEHGGGTIELRIRVLGPRVRVEVSDEGSGLPAPVAELVRRPRAGLGSRGRGLAIAAEIADRHGGRLLAAPVARGARLALELPACVPAAPAARLARKAS
jgi:signal transduction histidine kinase